MVPKNPNKRNAEDKEVQRQDGGERFKKHGTAKSRARARNRKRAAKKREEGKS